MIGLWSILAMGGSLFALRLSGLLAYDRAIPAEWEHGLRFVPIAILAAMVACSLANRDQELGAGVIAAIGAGVVTYKFKRLWLCIVTGLAIYLVVRQI
jgi:branched-subunit amino acid transport protein